VEHDALVVALDLILLKPGVYRHLLFNRGMPPRKVEESTPTRGQDDGQKEQRAEEKRVGAAAQDTARERVRVLTACARVIEPDKLMFSFSFWLVLLSFGCRDVI
jgi:hypothetical protein